MNKIKELEIKKLLKELDYIESDFEYKSEIITENDSKFMIEVSNFLEIHPDLKEMFDKKISDKIDNIIKKGQELDKTDLTIYEESENLSEEERNIDRDEDNEQSNEEIKEEEEDITNSESNKKIKKIYREIVKRTHPDKVNDKKLNNLYLKSTIFYDQRDLTGLYSICNEIGIDYDLDLDDVVDIESKIKSIKDKIGFVESTFTWKWHYCKNQSERDHLILLYIRMQLQ